MYRSNGIFFKTTVIELREVIQCLSFCTQLLVGDDVDVFLHTITEDDILENMPLELAANKGHST